MRRALLAIGALLLGAGGAVAQEAARPTVGLVLSGGAAKGLAHVGAIGVLEEAGLPVDVVAGTSMGSVVGGLYAIGYTPAAMERLVQGIDWTSLLTDATQRRHLDIERRLLSGETLVSLPIVDGGVRLPGGVTQGQRVLELLSRLTWPYHGVRDFDALPRPFTAVVMDLLTGEAVALDAGSLPLSIRASMSIPGLFEPVRMDGRTFVDGGFARNLPAEDALALGADVLVCVDVSDPPPDEDEIEEGTLISVLLRTAFLQGEASTAVQRRLCDVLIEPDVEGLSAFDFDATAEWVRRGRAAAESARPAIDSLVGRLGRIARPPIPPPSIDRVALDRIDVEGASPEGEILVRQRLFLEVPDVVTAADVTDAVARVHGTGEFGLVAYEILPLAGEAAPGRATRHRLVVRVEERPRDLLGFGFRYDSRERAALLFDLTLRNRLFYGSTTRVALRLGQETSFGVEYFDRLAVTAPTGVGGGLSYTRVPIRLFQDERALLEADLRVYAAEAYFSFTVADAVVLRAGLAGEYARVSPEVGADSVGSEPVEPFGEAFGSAWVAALADSRDRTDLPRRGWRARARAELADAAIGGGPTFRYYALEAEGYLPLFDAFTLMGRAAFTTARGEDIPASRLTFIGGTYAPTVLPGRFYPLFGTDAGELAGTTGQAIRVGLRWTPTENLFFEAAGDAGATGTEWTLDPGLLEYGVGLTGGLVTPIGPVSVTLAWGDPDDVPSVGFRLGYDF